jgi:hypothetical protein
MVCVSIGRECNAKGNAQETKEARDKRGTRNNTCGQPSDMFAWHPYLALCVAYLPFGLASAILRFSCADDFGPFWTVWTCARLADASAPVPRSAPPRFAFVPQRKRKLLHNPGRRASRCRDACYAHLSAGRACVRIDAFLFDLSHARAVPEC